MAVNATARDISRMMPTNLWGNRIAAESIAGVAIIEVAAIPNGILPTSPEEDKRRRWCLHRQLTGHATVLLPQQLPFCFGDQTVEPLRVTKPMKQGQTKLAFQFAYLNRNGLVG